MEKHFHTGSKAKKKYKIKKKSVELFLGWIPFLKHLKHSEKQNLLDLFFSPSFTQ